VNTPQLIVLWYAALLIVAVLLVGALDSFNSRGAASWFIAAIVVLAGVLIYTLKRHPVARRRPVALAVVIPLGLAAGWGLGWEFYREHQAERASRVEREALQREALDERALKNDMREAVRQKRRERGTVVIDVPNVGLTEFPANMSDEDLIRAIERQVAPAAEAEAIREEAAPEVRGTPIGG
jgi:hypothetical protein